MEARDPKARAEDQHLRSRDENPTRCHEIPGSQCQMFTAMSARKSYQTHNEIAETREVSALASSGDDENNNVMSRNGGGLSWVREGFVQDDKSFTNHTSSQRSIPDDKQKIPGFVSLLVLVQPQLHLKDV